MGNLSRAVFAQADVHRLPVRSKAVDRVTCRFGIMFFENTAAALAEIRRVLKPRGRVALLVWGPFEQPLFQNTIGLVLQALPHAELPPLARLAHRFAAHGSLSSELQRAGFADIRESELTVPRTWRGPSEQFWEFQQEINILFGPIFDSITTSMKAEIAAEVVARLARFRSGELLTIPAQVVLATAVNTAL